MSISCILHKALQNKIVGRHLKQLNAQNLLEKNQWNKISLETVKYKKVSDAECWN